MTIRSAVLFEDGRATGFLRSQWIRRDAAQPLSAAELIEDDGTANGFFRGLCNKALPSLGPLPDEPIANEDGTGTDEFWTWFG